MAMDSGLVGYWKLKGDCRDYSPKGNHGRNHGVALDKGEFNGMDAYIEVPSSASLNFGTRPFSISVWVRTEKEPNDIVGDILSKYAPQKRKGFTLNIRASGGGGYSGQGNSTHVCFGIDNARVSDWEDCGRPSETSNYVSNSLAVFDGELYAGTTDGKTEQDWCHVYRYQGDGKWEDCGRVGNLRTPGVGPLIVHGENLYAATWTYDWTRVHGGDYDPGHVYCYQGGTKWRDWGQPGKNYTLTCIASYQGKLYVGGNDTTGGVYKVFVCEGSKQWQVSGKFPVEGPKRCRPHAMAVHDGKLYVGYPAVYAYDGKEWIYAGTPETDPHSQLHSLEVYQGKLYCGTWPEGRVYFYKGGEDWEDCGRPGDSTEINGLVVYNGKLYLGSIPRAEVYRYDGGRKWTLMKRFFAPPGWEPSPWGYGGPDSRKRLNEWTRVTSLTVYDGKLFASIGSCTSSVLDAPCDVRGRVFCMEAGKCVSYDHDLGSGWKHITAVRERGRLKLYVNGGSKVVSSAFEPEQYDVSTAQALNIGFGEMDYFSGKIGEVRIYNRALTDEEIRQLCDAGR